MKIELTEEQEMLRASARDFLEKECTERVVQDVEASGLGYSPELWRKIAELGWFGLVFPQQFGGSEMSLSDLAVLCEELGRASFPGPFVQTVVYGGIAVSDAGSEELKASVLPGLIEGREIVAAVMEEPDTAETAVIRHGVTIEAHQQDEGFVLDGKALFVAGANIASRFLVPARTAQSIDHEDGITLFLADSSLPGISVTPLASLTGDIPCEVVFDQVKVSNEIALGSVNAGGMLMKQLMQTAAVMRSAQALGAGEKLLQSATQDYETRIMSDESARDPFAEQYFSRLRVDLDCCRRATYAAAIRLEEGAYGELDEALLDAWRTRVE